MKRSVSRTLTVLGVAAAAFLSSSCASRAARPPVGADSSAAQSLLGEAPDFAAVVHVDRLRADPVYGPLTDEVSKDSDAQRMYQAVTTLDIVGAFDGPKIQQSSIIATVRGVPSVEDLPGDYRRSIKDGDAHQLSSGVWEYATIASDGWPYGFYVAPHEWVLLSGKAAGHGHDWFSASASAPPAVDFGDDALVGVWIGPQAMHRASMAEEAKEPGSIGLESARIVLRDGAHGDLLYDGTYDTSAHAQDAMRVTSESVGMYASVWKSLVDRCPGLGSLTLEADVDGRSVHVRVANIPAAIRAAMQCEKSRG